VNPILTDKIAAKIFSPDELHKRIAFWRLSGDKVVFTNGCFDILHPGHIQLLSAAAQLGDRLILGLNSDKSVTRLKGETRPINPQQGRATVLAALEMIDAVVIFEEDTPENLIHFFEPDILVKGGDWKKEEIIGGDFVESYGGKVEVIPYLQGFSTTNILNRSKG
jgi:rfaE bifunctional protein nucleotidyltransferase chain/domain